MCGHCGCKMHGATLVRRKKGVEYRYPKYACSTHGRCGTKNPHGCGCHGVNQGLLVDVVTRKLRENLFSADSQSQLRSVLGQMLFKRRHVATGDLDGLRRQIGELDREIDRAAENFLRTPSELLDLVGQKLTAMKRQREHVADQIRLLATLSGPMEVDQQVDQVIDRLNRLGDDLQSVNVARRRAVFSELIERIELRFDKIQRGKRIECPLQSGLIRVRTGEGSVFGTVSRGDRI